MKKRLQAEITRASETHKSGNRQLLIRTKTWHLPGAKTQNIRAVIDNNEIKVSSFSGEPLKVEIPSESIQNSVAEKISLTNFIV